MPKLSAHRLFFLRQHASRLVSERGQTTANGKAWMCAVSIIGLAMIPALATATTLSSPTAQQSMPASENYKVVVPLPPPASEQNAPLTKLQEIVLRHSSAIERNPASGNRDRVVHVHEPQRNHPVDFPVRSGAEVVAGDGRQLGHLAADVRTVHLNFGQLKLIGGKLHVLVFAAPTAETGGATGWIAYADLLPSPELSESKPVLAINADNTPDHGDAPKRFRVACADPAGWGEGLLKIVPDVDEAREKHEAATDYVDRPGDHVCYLLLTLPRHGGVATDVLSNDNTFVPAAGVPRVNVPLYLPRSPTLDEQQKWTSGAWPHVMEFVYGRVGNRYGWIPSADLKKL